MRDFLLELGHKNKRCKNIQYDSWTGKQYSYRKCSIFSYTPCPNEKIPGWQVWQERWISTVNQAVFNTAGVRRSIVVFFSSHLSIFHKFCLPNNLNEMVVYGYWFRVPIGWFHFLLGRTNNVGFPWRQARLNQWQLFITLHDDLNFVDNFQEVLL